MLRWNTTGARCEENHKLSSWNTIGLPKDNDTVYIYLACHMETKL